MTPVEVAAGYTTFATIGTRAEPEFLKRVVGADGKMLEEIEPQTRAALDPRVAFLTTSVMKDVLNRGTGAAVRQKGFTLPAAGKTGTSRDGWFAGFTSNLVCVIWVGFDDNRDLGLTGGVAVAPIWADFMIRATALPAYRDAKDFNMPAGVQAVMIDPESMELATPNCPTTRSEFYVAGSAPTQLCELHGGRASGGSWLSHIFGGGQKAPQVGADGRIVPNENGPEVPGAVGADGTVNANRADGTEGEAGQKKKGALQKIFGIFGGKKKDPDKAKPPPEKGDSP
jgi:penicillin-binding protein 1B